MTLYERIGAVFNMKSSLNQALSRRIYHLRKLFQNSILMAVISLAFFSTLSADSLALSKHLDAAKIVSKAYQKPIMLVFTGSDWSERSKTILEILDDSEMQLWMRKHVVPVQVDFPELNRQSKVQLAENHELKEKFHIEQFPALLLCNAQEQHLGVVPLDLLQKEEMKKQIEFVSSEGGRLEKIISSLSIATSNEILKQVYVQAEKIHARWIMDALVKIGLEKKEDIFFALEALTPEYLGRKSESFLNHLKELIYGMDPNNDHEGHFRLALFEYQQAEERGESLSSRVKPLSDFLQNPSAKSKEKAKVHLLLTQVFLAGKQKESAKNHLKKIDLDQLNRIEVKGVEKLRKQLL